MEKQTIVFKDLGKMEYKSAWELQERILQQNVRIKSEVQSSESEIADPRLPTPDSSHTTHYLFFVEHPPVYTLGKSGKMENIILSEEERAKEGIEFFHTNRGGDITFHGPGQIVGYPILDLEKFYTDIGRYLRELEEVIILTLNDYGIPAGRSVGETGVWIDPLHKGKERKICAMGIRCSRWITMHGFALNVNTPLGYFDGIIPCGIADKKVSSIKEELGREVEIEEVKERLKRNFEKVFNVIITEEQLTSNSFSINSCNSF